MKKMLLTSCFGRKVNQDPMEVMRVHRLQRASLVKTEMLSIWLRTMLEGITRKDREEPSDWMKSVLVWSYVSSK